MLAEDPSTLAARLFVALQHVLPHHALSRIVYAVTRSKWPPLKNALIKGFVRSFRPDMADAVEPDPLRYPTFNDFFTRALRPDARPIETDPRALISPVDGTVSQIGRLNGMGLLQAKGRDYTLEALLAGPAEWSAGFAGGAFATLYLAPYNYHRIHMPLPGKLRDAWYVPGRLFSVNATTAAAVSNLFARNERLVCVFEHGAITFVVVLVGALFVGSMATVWHGEVTPRVPRRPCTLSVIPGAAPLQLARGAEMGRFNMGSTVILLLPPQAAEWLPEFKPGSRLWMGQPLGRLHDIP